MDIIKKLSKDDTARQNLVDIAINYTKENKELIKKINSSVETPESDDNITGSKENDSAYSKKIDTLLSISKTLKNDIYEAQNIISSNWRLTDSISIEYINDKADSTETKKPEKKADKDSVYFNYQLFIQDTLRVKNGDTIFLISKEYTCSIVKKTSKNRFESRLRNEKIPFFSGGGINFYLNESNSKKDKTEDYQLVFNKEDILVDNYGDSIQVETNKDIINKRNYIIFKRAKSKKVLLVAHKSIDRNLLKSIIPPVSSDLYKNKPKKIGIKVGKYKRKYVFAPEGFYKHLWGYILTALAISLGSPFWFDLLNKLIKLRSSVSQSNSKQSTTTKPNPNDPASPKNRVA